MTNTDVPVKVRKKNAQDTELVGERVTEAKLDSLLSRENAQ